MVDIFYEVVLFLEYTPFQKRLAVQEGKTRKSQKLSALKTWLTILLVVFIPLNLYFICNSKSEQVLSE